MILNQLFKNVPPEQFKLSSAQTLDQLLVFVVCRSSSKILISIQEEVFMSAPEALTYLECVSRDANNAYEWTGGGSRLDAFREALDDLRTRSFPNFSATSTISCLSVKLPFSLQDTPKTLNDRFNQELDDIARAYGDDV